MSERNRIVTVIGLIVFTALIIAAIIYVATTIQQSQAPENSQAAGSALTECILNLRPDILPFYQQNGWDINQHDAIVANWSGIAPAEYAEARAKCDGTASTKICGETCSANAQCKTPTSGGSAVCRNGRCENSACPVGQTQGGAACVCATASGGTTSSSNSGSGTSTNPVRCGDGICNNNETRAICPADCPATTTTSSTSQSTQSLPNTAIVSDEIDRIIVGIALLGVGLIIFSYHKRNFIKSAE